MFGSVVIGYIKYINERKVQLKLAFNECVSKAGTLYYLGPLNFNYMRFPLKFEYNSFVKVSFYGR